MDGTSGYFILSYELSSGKYLTRLTSLLYETNGSYVVITHADISPSKGTPIKLGDPFAFTFGTPTLLSQFYHEQAVQLVSLAKSYDSDHNATLVRLGTEYRILASSGYRN